MGRFTPKYTPQQREAIARAIVDQGMTGSQAALAAAQGQLQGVEPFQIPVASAYRIASDSRIHRRRQWAADDPEGAYAEQIDRAVHALLDITGGELDRLEREGRTSGRVDLKAVGEVMTLLEKHALPLAQEWHRVVPQHRNRSTNDHAPDLTGQSFADSLVRAQAEEDGETRQVNGSSSRLADD